VIENGFARLAGREQAEQSRDWKSQPTNASFASADGRVHRNTHKSHDIG
jgi:hypothetical protein